jgi:hypothetical protein
MCAESAGLLLSGNTEGKIQSCESVFVGGYDWRGEKLSIKCTYRFGGVIRSRCSFSVKSSGGMCSWSSDCCLVWNIWCERHKSFTSGWDGAECWFGAEGYSLWV